MQKKKDLLCSSCQIWLGKTHTPCPVEVTQVSDEVATVSETPRHMRPVKVLYPPEEVGGSTHCRSQGPPRRTSSPQKRLLPATLRVASGSSGPYDDGGPWARGKEIPNNPSTYPSPFLHGNHSAETNHVSDPRQTGT